MSINKKLSLIFIFNLLIAACAPVHIREHEATELNESTNLIKVSKSRYGGGRYYSIQSENIYGNLAVLNLLNKKNSLEISLNFIGKKNATIKINHKVLKFRYHAKAWQSIEGKISSSQWSRDFGVSNGSKEFLVAQPQFFKDYMFSLEDKDGNKEFLVFSAVIPKEEKDLEIEIPEIFLEGKLLLPKNLFLKWKDRWTLIPING